MSHEAITRRLSDIEERVRAVEVGAATTAAHNANVERRLSSIEDTLKWLVRLVVGGLIMALVAFLINGGFSV